MISESLLLSKFQKEAAYHKRLPETEFVRGILAGLKIAIFLLTETGKAGRAIRAAYKGRLSRWSAARFRQAIDTGIRYLKRGDKSRAMRILEGAIDHEADSDIK